MFLDANAIASRGVLRLMSARQRPRKAACGYGIINRDARQYSLFGDNRYLVQACAPGARVLQREGERQGEA